MNIDKLINFYVGLYPQESYSSLATKILAAHPEVDLSHSTIRQKVGKYVASLEETSLAEELDLEVGSIDDCDCETICDFCLEEANDAIAEEVELQPYLLGDPRNVLIIGDPHAPFTREGYMRFCREQQELFNCGTVVCIGDIVDNHYSSFHEQDPDGRSAGDELELTIKETREWHRVFPNAYCTIGNHDAIIMRKAFSSGLSSRWIKGLAEVLEMPTWKFVTDIELYGVLYTHTLGGSLLNAAMARRQSVVCGHLHTKAEIQWNANKDNRIFSMQVGCGIDDKAYAFNYAKLTAKKSFISCGVVLNSGYLPIVVPMEL